MQAVRRKVGAALVLMVALVALAAFVGANTAMAGTASKHKGAKVVAKHVAKKAKHSSRFAALKTSSTDPTAEAAGAAETGGAAESAADTAAQDAACTKAGVDPNGNVQFDDASGTCSLDTGGTGTQTQ